MSNIALGRVGEDLAVSFLERAGYRIMERNYRFERAEVDIVCFEPDTNYELGGEIVFVEVKARASDTFAAPEDAVTAEKQRQIVKASRAYLYESKLERSPCRFDVISIVVDGDNPPRITHFKNAFWAP